MLQGEISSASNKVISYLLTKDASASGLAQGRVERDQKRLTLVKATAVITAFYSEHSEPTGNADGKANGKVANGKGKKNGKKKARREEIIDLSDDSDSDMTVEVAPDAEAAAEDGSGEALATVLGLPEKVMSVQWSLCASLSHIGYDTDCIVS